MIGWGSNIIAQGDQSNYMFNSFGVAAIILGLIITMISFFGCFGAANEKGKHLSQFL